MKILPLATLLLFTSLARAAPADALIDKGDVFDRKFQANEALEYFLPAEKLEPARFGLLLRIARQYRHLMADATSPEEKLRLGALALAYGQKAAALAPEDSEAQLSPAITYGKMLPFQGKKEQVETAPLIKAAVDKALRLDPRNDTAWHVLGRWHQGLADVSGLKRSLGQFFYGKLPVGTNADAVLCFENAIKLNPRRLRHYIELGRTYAHMGDTASARSFIEKGLAMPSVEKDDPEIKARGRETLGTLP